MTQPDIPGYCVKCHNQVADFDGSLPNGNPRIVRLMPTFCSVNFRLDNGSQMLVAMCVDCRDKLAPEDTEIIMEAVINGWQREMDQIVEGWEDQKKLDYMASYSQRSIIDRLDKRWSDEEVKRVKPPREDKLHVKTGAKK